MSKALEIMHRLEQKLHRPAPPSSPPLAGRGSSAASGAAHVMPHPPAGARAAWDELREEAPDVLQDIGLELLKEHSKGLKVSLGKP